MHVTGSALIVAPASGRVLLRWHPRQQAWLQVGGHGDPGELDPLGIGGARGGRGDPPGRSGPVAATARAARGHRLRPRSQG